MQKNQQRKSSSRNNTRKHDRDRDYSSESDDDDDSNSDSESDEDDSSAGSATTGSEGERKDDDKDKGNESTEDYSDDEDEGEDGYKAGGYHRVKVGEVYNQRWVACWLPSPCKASIFISHEPNIVPTLLCILSCTDMLSSRSLDGVTSLQYGWSETNSLRKLLHKGNSSFAPSKCRNQQSTTLRRPWTK